MNFSIDYDKLGELGGFLANKSHEIDNIYSDIVDVLVAIDDNWKSEDSSVYVYKIVSFVKEIISDNEQITGASKLLTSLSNKYGESDVKWEKDILREDNDRNE